jgi:hypothetical protein
MLRDDVVVGTPLDDAAVEPVVPLRVAGDGARACDPLTTDVDATVDVVTVPDHALLACKGGCCCDGVDDDDEGTYDAVTGVASRPRTLPLDG